MLEDGVAREDPREVRLDTVGPSIVVVYHDNSVHEDLADHCAFDHLADHSVYNVPDGLDIRTSPNWPGRIAQSVVVLRATR